MPFKLLTSGGLDSEFSIKRNQPNLRSYFRKPSTLRLRASNSITAIPRTIRMWANGKPRSRGTTRGLSPRSFGTFPIQARTGATEYDGTGGQRRSRIDREEIRRIAHELVEYWCRSLVSRSFQVEKDLEFRAAPSQHVNTGKVVHADHHRADEARNKYVLAGTHPPRTVCPWLRRPARRA